MRLGFQELTSDLKTESRIIPIAHPDRPQSGREAYRDRVNSPMLCIGNLSPEFYSGV